MSSVQPPSPLHDADYEAIEAAVMETAKGRWFLAEHARRQRAADTASVLAALEALGETIQARQPNEPPAREVERSRRLASAMRDALERTRRDVANLKPDPAEAGDALDGVVSRLDATTLLVADAARNLADLFQSAEGAGIDPGLIRRCNGLVDDILSGCGTQDATSRQVLKLVQAFHFLSSRADGLAASLGLETLPAPEPVPPAETSSVALAPEPIVARREEPEPPAEQLEAEHVPFDRMANLTRAERWAFFT